MQQHARQYPPEGCCSVWGVRAPCVALAVSQEVEQPANLPDSAASSCQTAQALGDLPPYQSGTSSSVPLAATIWLDSTL